MTPYAKAKTEGIRPRNRAMLLGGTALCSVVALLAQSAQGQTLPSIPVPADIKISAGGAQPVITAPNTNTLDVDLNAARTVVNWGSFHVSGADSVNFHFDQASDIVLNKSPTAVRVDAGGHVTGKVGAVTGGNIWFYSPQGVVISPGAVMTAGNFVFSRGSAIDDMLFVADANPLGFLRAAADSLIQVDTVSLATTASIGPTGDVVLSAATGNLLATTVLAAGSATVTATAGSLTLGEVTANGGAATIQALSGVAKVTSATATGDVIVTGSTEASLTTGVSGRDLKVSGPAASLGTGDATRDILVTGTTGGATVATRATAGDDVEITATTGSVTATGAELKSTGAGALDDAHVLARSTGGSVHVGSAETQGTLLAAGDVTVDGALGASLNSGVATRDVRVTSGFSATLSNGDAGRDIYVNGVLTSTLTTGDAGRDINVLGDTASAGSATAGGDINVSGVNATLTSGDAGGDINVSGATATLTTGDAGRDINVLGDTASAGSATAGGDINVSGVNATLTSGDAGGDINVQADDNASVGSGEAGGGINVNGRTVSLGSGDAGRDILITATDGDATITGHATAGGNVEVTASGGLPATPGSVIAGGATLTSTGVGATGEHHVLARSAAGSVHVGSAVTGNGEGQRGDITVDGHTTARLDSGGSSRDLFVSGPVARLGAGRASETIVVSGTTSATVDSANAGHGINITADTASLGSGFTQVGDIIVTASNGDASVLSSASAADDVEITAQGGGSVRAGGAVLTSRGGPSEDDGHVFARSTEGSVAVGAGVSRETGPTAGDVVLDGATGATLGNGTRAGRDLLITAAAGNVAVGDDVRAGRDVAVTATVGSLSIGSIDAGDDIALRALGGSIGASGDVRAGQTASGNDLAGVADTAAGLTDLTGHDLYVRAATVNMRGSLAAGRNTPGPGLDAAQLASDVTVVTTANPDSAVPALRVATDPGKTVSAHQDIDLHTDAVSGGSILTGGLEGGRDIAVYSPTGNIALRSALAGDDVVLRAPLGSIDVAGDMKAGRDLNGVTATDAPGVGDALNTALPFLDFNGNVATIFSVVGFDVNTVSQSIRVGGATVAGRQASTDNPDAGGPIDDTTSDIRIETLVSETTPTVGLAPDITLGSVTATRDVQIDSYRAVRTGDLQAGRDIAVLGRGGPTPGSAPGDHSGAGVTVASAHAGDDVVIFSIWGHAGIGGDVTSGSPFARLRPTNDRVIDGATEAGDQLAIYLHYFDLDEASSPYVLNAGQLLIRGEGVNVGGNLTAMGEGSDIRLRSTSDILVSGAAAAGKRDSDGGFFATGDALFTTEAISGASITVHDVTAARNVFIDGGDSSTTNTVETGVLAAVNSDVAVRADSITLGGAAAGDDVVLRGKDVLIKGSVAAGAGAADSIGVGDALVSSDGAISLETATFDLTGHDADIKATGTVTAKTPDPVDGTAPVRSLLKADGASSDVRVQADGAIQIVDARAGRDVMIDGGSTVTTAQLEADRDVGVRSRGLGATVKVGGAVAGDDVVIRADGDVVVRPADGDDVATGELTAHGANSTDADQAGDLMFNADRSKLSGDFDLVGQNVDVRSSGGAIAVAGAVNADTDARFQTGEFTGGSVSVAEVTAGQNVLLDGNGITADGAVTSTHADVAIRSRETGAISLKDVAAGDDVVIRGTDVNIDGSVTAGTGQGIDSLGYGERLLAETGAISLGTTTFDLTGHDVDIKASGKVTAKTPDPVDGAPPVRSLLKADGVSSDVRVQAEGAIQIVDARAGRDVLIDGGAAVTTAQLNAGRDVGVRSRGLGAAVKVGGAVAGDDVVIRADGDVAVGPADDDNVATGELTAHGANSTDADQAGDLMFNANRPKLNGEDFKLLGQNVDVRSTHGAIGVAGAVNADTDARFQTEKVTGGAVSVAEVTAGENVLLDGSAVAASGTVTATNGDVAIRARSGAAALGDVSGGDDVAIRADGAVTAGAITTHGRSTAGGLADQLIAESGALTVASRAFDLSGSDIDVVAGSADIGSANGAGAVRLKASAGEVVLSSATAGQDILIDATGSVRAGDLAAGADVAVRSTGGSLDVDSASAGDDVVLRAASSVRAGNLTSSSSDADGAGDLLFGVDPTSLRGNFGLSGGNIDVKANGGSVEVSGATANADLRLQAAGETRLSSDSTAGRDILMDGASVAAGGALQAGRDIALFGRSGGVALNSATAGDDIAIRAAGTVTATGALSSGAGGDSDGAGDRLAATAGSLTVAGVTFNLAGGAIDIRGAGVNLTGALRAEGANGSVRVQSEGALTLSTANATGDVLLDATGDLTTGALTAGRDIGARSTGAGITIASAAAGDDIVLRAAHNIGVAGGLTARGGPDGAGAADLLAGADGVDLAGGFDLTGSTIDVRTSGGGISALGGLTAGSDVRLQTAGGTGGDITTGDVTAGRDVLLDGASVTAGAVSADRDIAVRSRTGGIVLGSASARDDIVLRAAGAIKLAGVASALGEADGEGAGDRLFGTDRTQLTGDFDLAGSNLDAKSSGGAITMTGAASAGRDVRLQTVGSGEITTSAVTARGDIFVDASSVRATGLLKADGDVALRGRTGTVEVASLSAGDDIVLRAAGAINVTGEASASGGADSNGVGDRLFWTDRTKLNGDFDLAGSNLDAKSGGGAITMTGAVSTGRDVRLQTVGSGEITASAVTARGDIFADASSVRATGLLKADGDVALRSRTGTVEVASLSAGDDIAVRAAGAFNASGTLSSNLIPNSAETGAADRLISTSEGGMIMRLADPALSPADSIKGFTLKGGDIDIRSGGAITIGGEARAVAPSSPPAALELRSSVRLQSSGKTSLAAVAADGAIFVRSSDLLLGGTWKATTARIESTAAGGVALGSGVTAGAGAMTLSNDQINLIDAATLQIFVGDTSGTMRGSTLSIGALSIDVAKVRTALELYAGSGVDVRITGAFAPSSEAANTTAVRIGAPSALASDWTPKSIRVIADNGGSIGFSTTTDGRTFSGVRAFGRAELNAKTDILIGYQDFIDKLAVTDAADVANVVKTFRAPQGPNGPRMLVTVGGLSLRADGKVASQDTSAAAALTRTGMFLTGAGAGPADTALLSLGRVTPATAGAPSMPQYIELYGAVKLNVTVLANENVALSNLIAFLPGLSPSQYYRLNTCVIFQTGNCTPTGGLPNTNISPDRLTVLNLLDGSSSAGAADPTVASATNEEIWKAPE